MKLYLVEYTGFEQSETEILGIFSSAKKAQMACDEHMLNSKALHSIRKFILDSTIEINC